MVCEDELMVVFNVVYDFAGSEFEVVSLDGCCLLAFDFEDLGRVSVCSRGSYVGGEVPYDKYVDALKAGGCLPPPNCDEVLRVLRGAARENVFSRPRPVYFALDTNLLYLRFPTHFLSFSLSGLRIALPEPVLREVSWAAGREEGRVLPLDVRLAKQALAEYDYVEKKLGAHLVRGEGRGDRAIALALKSFSQGADVVLLTSDDNMRITAMSEGVATLLVEQQRDPELVRLSYRNLPVVVSSLAVTYSTVKLETVSPLTVTQVQGWWRGKRNEDWLSRRLRVQTDERIGGMVLRELRAVRGGA
ncbi:MAG: PIN domain-containing protein [Candidatus Jordarchaeales archaeon]